MLIISNSAYKKMEVWFWIAYVMIIVLSSGVFTYNWLPNESYDETLHVQLQSHIEDDGGPEGNTWEATDKWQSRNTGEVFTRKTFSKHHWYEKIRLAFVWSAYTFFGCMFYSYGRHLKEDISYKLALKESSKIIIGVILFIIILF